VFLKGLLGRIKSGECFGPSAKPAEVAALQHCGTWAEGPRPARRNHDLV